MKGKYVSLILLCLVLLLSGCKIIVQPAATDTPLPVTQPPEITQVPLDTQTPLMDTAAPALTMPPTNTSAPQGEPTPDNTMDFYSCYAFMVSYNPSNGWAEFDYFYMLTGQDAIDYLVDYEGYSQANAEDMVNNFVETEFVTRNRNTGLRTIDLDTVPLKLMYHPDGTMVSGAQGITSTTADVAALYSMNPNYLFEYFFFYIHCDSNGNVTSVEQVYWC